MGPMEGGGLKMGEGVPFGGHDTSQKRVLPAFFSSSCFWFRNPTFYWFELSVLSCFDGDDDDDDDTTTQSKTIQYNGSIQFMNINHLKAQLTAFLFDLLYVKPVSCCTHRTWLLTTYFSPNNPEYHVILAINQLTVPFYYIPLMLQYTFLHRKLILRHNYAFLRCQFLSASYLLVTLLPCCTTATFQIKLFCIDSLSFALIKISTYPEWEPRSFRYDTLCGKQE